MLEWVLDAESARTCHAFAMEPRSKVVPGARNLPLNALQATGFLHGRTHWFIQAPSIHLPLALVANHPHTNSTL